MKLILHPGFPKSGSSAIQQCLYRNWEQLLSEGYVLPDRAMNSPFQDCYRRERPGYPLGFLHAVSNGERVSEFCEKLDILRDSAEERGAKAVIITSENLVNEGEGYDLILKEAAERFSEVEVIAYMRRADDFYLSAWKQWGYHQGISFECFVDTRLGERYPNFWDNCCRLEQLLGVERVTLTTVCSVGLRGNPLVVDFLRKIGSELTVDADSFESLNRGLNPYLCEVLSQLGKLEAQPFSNRIKELLHNLSTNHELLYARCPEYGSQALRQRIMDTFEGENRKLHEKYFPDLDFGELFSVRIDSPTVSRLQRLEDLAQLEAGIIIGVLASL